MKNLLEAGATLLFALPFSAFTPGQREAIKERDDNQCQGRGIIPHRCVKEKHVHHRLPQRYCKELGIDPDFAENGITLCRNAHDAIHPDMIEARVNYGSDNDSYKKVFEARDKLIENHQIYWNDTWDRQLQAKAVKNTQQAQKRGWIFPAKNGKK